MTLAYNACRLLWSRVCTNNQVLAAASVVAFGPALVLEYVPTAKVEVRDPTSAGSTAGRVRERQRELVEEGVIWFEMRACLSTLMHAVAHS